MTARRFLDIPPLERVFGTVRVPGSKSISNRALLLAGFAEGTTRLDGVLRSDDTDVMVAALRGLGAAIDDDGDTLRVTGVGIRPAVASARFFLGNAGTAMRPLAAALAIVAQSTGAAFELHGTPRMHERPIGDLVEALRGLGCAVECLGREGFPPLRVGRGDGIRDRPLDLARPVRVRGDVSSQFLSALLLALPLRGDVGPAVIEVEGELISRPYIDLTLAVLARFGVEVERDSDTFRVPGARPPRSPGRCAVEGDASSASYLVAAGAVAADAEAPLRIQGVGRTSIQGDLAFVDAVRAMGAQIELEDDAIVVARGRFPLAAIDIDCIAMPDAAMTLAALALYADAPSRLTGIASWRVKETDRLAAMERELRRCGAMAHAGADRIEVAPPTTWVAAAFETYDDHRMAMALSLAAFNGRVSRGHCVPMRICEPGVVAKTWPGYFEVLFSAASVGDVASIPVLTIDGPTASGKGTLSAAVAAALGYRLLDSGAVYRAAALAALDIGINADDEAGLARLCIGLDLVFEAGRTLLAGRDVTDALRLEHVGAVASRISAWPSVRAALLDRQLAFRDLPGLVADGRDMGSVVFPDAALKVFLTASASARAERRHRQLIAKAIPANIIDLRADLEARDARDSDRSASPLRPAEGALLLDNSALSIDASVDVVLEAWQERRPF